MEHIAAVLLIVGCSPDFAECRELPAPVALFETAEECKALLPGSLAGFRSPRLEIKGTCVLVDPAAEEEDAELAWQVSPEGKLSAEIVTGALVAREATEDDQSGAF